LVQLYEPSTKVLKALNEASIGVGGNQNDIANGTRDIGYSNWNEASPIEVFIPVSCENGWTCFGIQV
jgi:hypothetical protein